MRTWSPLSRESRTTHQRTAMLPATAGAPPASGGASSGLMRSVANLSGPSADLPARSATSCCDAWRNETLNAPLRWMSLQVRLPGCSAMTTIGGTNETYIAVPVAHERSPPSAAPMIATPCGIRDSAVRATSYRSPAVPGIRARLAGMVKWSDNSAVAPGGRARCGVWEVDHADGPRASRLGHRDLHGDHRGLRRRHAERRARPEPIGSGRVHNPDARTDQDSRRVRQRDSGESRAVLRERER